MKTTLVRYSAQPETPQKSQRQKPFFLLRVSALVISGEQSTLLSGFYYCLTYNASKNYPIIIQTDVAKWIT